MTFILSYIVYVTVELPFGSIEKYVFRKKAGKNPPHEYKVNSAADKTPDSQVLPNQKKHKSPNMA